MTPRTPAAWSALLLTAAIAEGQPSAGLIPPGLIEALRRPTTLRQGIGRAHDAVATRSTNAQAFYDQGLAELHSHEWIEAGRSFHQALRLDPALAIAEAGLSTVYGALGAAGDARASLDRAQAMAASASEHDRRHIDVRRLELAAEASRDAADVAAYRNALDAALAAHPTDAELWVMRGLAQSADPNEHGEASVATSAGFFERALELTPDYFPAHHYLAHAYENSDRPGEALTPATTYARLAPAVAHAHHVHGHVLARGGRMAEAATALETAERLGGPPEDRAHNRVLLAAAYRYLGRIRASQRLLVPPALPGVAELVPPASPGEVDRDAQRMLSDLLLARGRTEDALREARRLITEPRASVRAAGHIAAGRALARLNRLDDAAREADAAVAELGAAPEQAGPLVPALETLQGELLVKRGQPEKGRAMLDEIIRRLREATGAHRWPETLFTIESIFHMARAVGDWEFAGFVARQLAAEDASYAGGQYALALVAEHNGDGSAARSAFARAAQAWATADPDLPEAAESRRKSR